MSRETIVGGPTSYMVVAETPLKLVDCPDTGWVTATGPIRHLCPYVDEVDEGTVTVRWLTDGATIELYSLRDYLDTYAESRLSHEAVAALILGQLDGIKGITEPSVDLEFVTAGFECRVTPLAEA